MFVFSACYNIDIKHAPSFAWMLVKFLKKNWYSKKKKKSVFLYLHIG